MIIETGHFALILAFFIACAQAVAGFRAPQKAAVFTRRAAVMAFMLCLLSYASLTWAYLTTDLSVLNVVENSHTLKPLLYKISGVWGNHEGSILLWVLLLAAYGALAAIRRNDALTDKNRSHILATQGALIAGFLSFILLTSNPFARIFPPPVDGQDLNPALQDPALALHPPLLYAGYVGFSIVFAFAVAALLEGKVSPVWARLVKPWIVFSWACLSAGIALGSYWAYYELGWGGWWFWDPVENASLLPWLVGTALLHSVSVLEKRDTLRRWSVLLCLIAFTLSMFGTFLVRSGILTSVHAFALDPARGLYVLALLFLFSGAGFTLYALRAARLGSSASFAPLSRESALIFNNLLVLTIAATILTGMLYPLLSEALFSHSLSVGPPYFHATVVPLAVPMIALMGIGPYLPWKKAEWPAVFQRIQLALLLTIAAGLLAFLQNGLNGAAILGSGLAIWLVSATLSEWGERAGLRPQKPNRRERIRKMSAAQWSMSLAHLGLGIAIIGMLGSTLGQQSRTAVLRGGETLSLGGYEITLRAIEPAFGPNYSALRFNLDIRASGGRSFSLFPEKRYYTIAKKETTEAGIRTAFANDLYIVPGDLDKASGGWVIRAQIHPFIGFLWFGYALVAIGGFVGLWRKKNE